MLAEQVAYVIVPYCLLDGLVLAAAVCVDGILRLEHNLDTTVSLRG